MTHSLTRSVRLAVLGLMAATLAACASAPASQDMSPPQRKGMDAKTQLESGRR